MKLLFDENLSHKLPAMLGGIFPGSSHVRACGLRGDTDERVWDYARANGFILVSKDSDFYQRAVFLGSPPKVVWVRIGNCSTQSIQALLTKNQAAIDSFEKSADDILILS